MRVLLVPSAVGMLAVISLILVSVEAQTKYKFHEPGAATQASSSTTTEQRIVSGEIPPSRMIEKTRTEADGRKVTTRILERLSPDKHYQPVMEREEEAIQVDEQTVRTIERVFTMDADGRRREIETTHEEKRTLPGGAQRLVRTTSQPDINGGFGVVRREVMQTEPTASNTKRTQSTVLTPDINGGFAPSTQITRTERRREDGTVETERIQLVPDGNGGWQRSEVTETVVQPEGQDGRREEERIYRRDSSGKLSLARRTVVNQRKDANEDEHKEVQVYATSMAGGVPYGDGTIRLDERLRVVRRIRPDGTQDTTQLIEKRGAANPADGLRAEQVVVETSRPDGRGGSERQTRVKGLDGNGRFIDIIVFDIRESTDKK